MKMVFTNTFGKIGKFLGYGFMTTLVSYSAGIFFILAAPSNNQLKKATNIDQLHPSPNGI